MHEHLAQATSLRRAAAVAPDRARRRDAVRRFQAYRLTRTYADLLANPRYRPAAEFFLSDLYATRDLASRDAQLERALGSLVKLLPGKALAPIAMALEVDALSERLDDALAVALTTVPADGALLDEETYAQAYRASDLPAERERQIMLIVGTGEQLDRIAHVPMLGTTIHIMRGPAVAAEFGELQSFLERGLAAFRQMRGATEFLATIRTREAQTRVALLAQAAVPRTG